jgi:hypothetical protein
MSVFKKILLYKFNRLVICFKNKLNAFHGQLLLLMQEITRTIIV